MKAKKTVHYMAAHPEWTEEFGKPARDVEYYPKDYLAHTYDMKDMMDVMGPEHDTFRWDLRGTITSGTGSSDFRDDREGERDRYKCTRCPW